MKRIFERYAVIWVILFTFFNVITFVPGGWIGTERYTVSFWLGYILITLSFIGQFACTYFANRKKDLQKTFYNISLITTSYVGLVLSLIFGGLCMLIPVIPYWLSIILCVAVLVFNIISFLNASAVIDTVSQIDEKIKVQTYFITSLTMDIEGLMARAKSDVVRQNCKKIYEAVRYSDPMSNSALETLEAQIISTISKLSDAIREDDNEKVKAVVDELLFLLSDRNKRCKMLK